MSDWLEQLSELEQQASRADWRKEIGDGPEWQEDKGYLVTKQAPSESVVCRLDWPSDMSSDSRSADAALIVALRNSATDLIERARRAEELEQAYENLLVSYYLSEKSFINESSSTIKEDEAELVSECEVLALQYLGKNASEVLGE